MQNGIDERNKRVPVTDATLNRLRDFVKNSASEHYDQTINEILDAIRHESEDDFQAAQRIARERRKGTISRHFSAMPLPA